MFRPSYSSRFYHPKNSGWGIQIIQIFSVCSFLHSLANSSPSLHFSLNVSDRHSHPYKITGKIIVLLSRNNQHYALKCTTPLFNIQAPICLGSSLPSSGSFLESSELLEMQIE
jgi:hypothetical protein